MWKNESGPFFYNTCKVNSEQIKDLNIRPETVKLLEKNVEENLHRLVLAMTTKALAQKAKLEKLRLYQTKQLLHSKKSNYREKRQPTEWEKIFANHLSDQGFIFKTYKSTIKQQKLLIILSKNGQNLE